MIRWSQVVTVFWGFGLVWESFRLAMNADQSAWSFFPRFILPPNEVTAWYTGVAAAWAFTLYYLMNYTADALSPGAGKPYARTAAWVVVISIGLFGPCFTWIFCIIAAYRLLNRHTRFVLSAEYEKDRGHANFPPKTEGIKERKPPSCPADA